MRKAFHGFTTAAPLARGPDRDGKFANGDRDFGAVGRQPPLPVVPLPGGPSGGPDDPDGPLCDGDALFGDAAAGGPPDPRDGVPGAAAQLDRVSGGLVGVAIALVPAGGLAGRSRGGGRSRPAPRGDRHFLRRRG